MTPPAHELHQREGLPDALRVLVEAFPREIWESHENFSGLVAFWLGRHLMFRRLLDRLQTDAEAVIDGQTDPERYKDRLGQLGSMLLNQLHGHHQIEDHHYFPRLIGMEPQLDRGFTLLDADHHVLDERLSRFATIANGVIREGQAPGPVREEIIGFERFLNRHLVDEEDLIVPIILKHGFEG